MDNSIQYILLARKFSGIIDTVYESMVEVVSCIVESTEIDGTTPYLPGVISTYRSIYSVLTSHTPMAFLLTFILDII